MRAISKPAWGLAAASGILQALVFPQPSLAFLSWVALAPLLLALAPKGKQGEASPSETVESLSPMQGFLLGYASGVIWYLGSCYFIFHVMHKYGGLPAPVAAVLLALFCLYLALYHGVFGALFVLLARTPALGGGRAIALAPVLWVAVELARTRVTGIPWNLLGTAQVDNIPLARLATVTGVYGVSFAIVLVNAAFAVAFLLPRARRRVMQVAAVGAALALQAGVLAKPEPAAATHMAVLVQQNLPTDDSVAWTAEKFAATLDDFRALSRSGAEQASLPREPRLIVWPESPAPFFGVDPNFRRPVSALAVETGAWVLTGNLGTRPSAQRERDSEVLNSASMVSPQGEWTARYDKIHLVPFGEYVPFQKLLGFARALTSEVGDFARGSERTVFTLDGKKLAVFICYESIFPDEVRQFAAGGAQAFVNISNDGWFGETGAPGQHLNMARMRAIENRRWVLRATNTGITASIDPDGRVVARAERNQRLALPAPYAFVSGTTLYTRHGDWFAYACAIIAVAATLVAARWRRRT